MGCVSVIALDVGDKHIGIAVSDPLGVLSTPFRTLERTNLDEDMQRLREIIIERGAHSLVVGFPLNMDGTSGPEAQRMESLIQSLRRLGLPVYKVDERLSSREAEQRMVQAGLDVRERNLRRDEFSAAVILQRYFDEGPIP
jgi:putative Holliday junction resolvase